MHLKNSVISLYDSWEGYYIVHTEHGEVKFYKDEQGLPYIDLSSSSDQAATMLVQTVRGNYEGYTKKEVLQAKEARRGQGMIGSPSESDYKGMVSSNLIRNCDITPHDVSNARKMFGPQLQGVRGKQHGANWIQSLSSMSQSRGISLRETK